MEEDLVFINMKVASDLSLFMHILLSSELVFYTPYYMSEASVMDIKKQFVRNEEHKVENQRKDIKKICKFMWFEILCPQQF